MTASALSLQAPVVVRSPNWLGDAVMALPAVRNVKTLLGDEALVVASPAKLAALWSKCTFVDSVIVLKDSKNLAETAGQLRLGKFAAAILLPNSLRVAAEAWLAGIPRRIGYARNRRSLLLTQAVPVPPRNPARLHQRFYYLDLVSALGGPDDPSLPRLRKDPTSVKYGSNMVLAICPGAEYGPAKRWPVENFAAVAHHFIATRHARIIVLGAPADVPVADALVRLVPGAENLAGKTSLDDFMAALITARLVVSNDSGSMHVASALGVPTLAVFGSTEPQLTGPMGARSRAMRHHVPCSPCFLRECPIDFACMKSITPEMAIAVAETMLR